MHTVALPESHRPVTVVPAALWAGRILSTLPVLFLAIDTAIKLLQLPVAADATRQLGFPAGAMLTIGLIEACCLVLYVLPRTSLLGLVLWTGYFGGAIATHLRTGGPLFTHMMVPVYVSALLWLGAWLRDGRLRRIVRDAFAAAM